MKQKRLEFNFLRRDCDELSTIQAALKNTHTAGADAQVVIVKGLSGTGKSAFVGATVDNQKNVLYSAAKFDQRGSSVPFAALRSVLLGLCNQITIKNLVEDCQREIEREVPRTHQKVLTSFVPRINSLLPRPILEEEEDSSPISTSLVSGEEGVNVVKLALRSFFSAISKVSSTIVCMDDIMWSDQATLDILQSILSDRRLKRVFFCCIYRSNEVDKSHPLVRWQLELEKKIDKVHYITIGNFKVQQVEKLLSDAMWLETEQIAELAQIVHGRTHGNILYILQLMEKLQDTCLLSFDALLSRWTWNICEIEEQTFISENVVELVSSRIENLEPQVQNVLKLASCLGARFDVQLLDAVKSVFGIDSVRPCLEEARNLDLIIKLDEQNYKFAHDTIQFASASLLPKGKDLMRINWNIGNDLLQSPHINDNRTMYACANQFIKALDLIDSDTRIAELFLSVGRNAMELSAFVRASSYLKAGIDALGTSPFRKDYDTALRLFSLYGKTEYCTGNMDESKRVAELVLAHAKVVEDQIDAHITLISCLFSKGNVMDSIDYSLKLLGQLGESVPKHPTSRQLRKEYKLMKNELRDKSDADILSLPFTHDRSKTTYVKVLYDMMMVCFPRDLLSLVEFSAMKMVRSTLKDGLTTFSPAALALAGSYFIAYKTNINEGYRFGELAHGLAATPSFTVSACRTLHWVGGMTRATVIPLSQCLDTLLEGHKAGMQSGDLNFAYNCIICYCFNYFYSGLPLTPLLQDVENFCLQMLEYKQNLAFFMNVPLWQCLLNLCGKSEDPSNIEVGYAIDKLNEVENHQKMSDSMNAYQMQIVFYMGNLDKATELMNKLKALRSGMRRASIVIWSRYFFFALIAMGNFRKFKKRKYKAEAKAFNKEVEQLVKAGVINIAHRLQILEAEYLSLTCRDSKKVYQSYQVAIKAATRSGFVQDAALANYLCAEYCGKTKEKMMLQQIEHLYKSHELWVTWGATAVADSLHRRHASVFRHEMLSRDSEISDSSRGSFHRGRTRFDRKYEENLYCSLTFDSAHSLT